MSAPQTTGGTYTSPYGACGTYPYCVLAFLSYPKSGYDRSRKSARFHPPHREEARVLWLLDCQSKCNRQIEKGLIWGTKAETLSGTVVQTFRNPQNIAVPNLPEVDPLGQIFANESVRVDKESKRPTQLTSFVGRLLISFVPRSQGLWGWAKYTGTPKAADTSLCRANSFPLSVVRVRHSTPLSRWIRAT